MSTERLIPDPSLLKYNTWYNQYEGRGVGKILHYMQIYMGLHFAERVQIGNGQVFYNNKEIATYSWYKNTDLAIFKFLRDLEFGPSKENLEKEQVWRNRRANLTKVSLSDIKFIFSEKQHNEYSKTYEYCQSLIINDAPNRIGYFSYLAPDNSPCDIFAKWEVFTMGEFSYRAGLDLPWLLYENGFHLFPHPTLLEQKNDAI